MKPEAKKKMNETFNERYIMGLKISYNCQKLPMLVVFLPFLDPLHTITTFSARFPHKISHKIAHSISQKNFPQDFPQDFPARISHKIFPQDFPELDPDWLAAHHPIPNAKFPPITAFLKLAFSPPPCPARFSCKIFLQEFPTRFSHKIFLSWILIGWLPITLFQMLYFHQSLPFLNWLFSLLPVLEDFPGTFAQR